MVLNKTDVPGIYKDRDGVLINKDDDGLKAYRQRKLQIKKMQTFEEDLCNMKSDLHED